MASIVLRSAGAAAGNALLPGFGGAFFGALGGKLGNQIDGRLGLAGHVEGPRLENLSVQDSRYGAGIPIIYGRARVAGNVIWSSDLIEQRHDSSIGGGKGGGSARATTYSYSVHCAVAIGEGVLGGVRTIWADSKVIYQNGVWTSGFVDAANIYTGTMTQSPDPFLQSMLGAANVPAWRGIAYVVLENFQLADFGNRLPNLTFEVYPATTDNGVPQWSGAINAQVRQTATSVQNGGMPPLAIEQGTSAVRRVIVGGQNLVTSLRVFEVVEMSVGDDAPQEVARTQSASFTASSVTDISWSLSPDGRYVALYLQCTMSPSHYFVLYDTETRSFGTVLGLSLSTTTALAKKISWLDPLHLVIADSNAGQRGVRVLLRSGLNLIDAGFTGVWGAGSLTTRLPPFYAEFLPYAGGLLSIMTDNTTGTLFSILYARVLVWRGNALVVGSEYVIISGVSTGLSSGQHINIVQTAQDEWTLCAGTVNDYYLLSFVPSLSSATITRPWQRFVPSFGLGTTSCPVAFGDRLIIVQQSVYENAYRISELSLGSSSFTLTRDAALMAGTATAVNEFAALRLDGSRMLVISDTLPNYVISQVGILGRGNTGASLPAIVSDVLQRAGYANSDYDVSGLSGEVSGYVLHPPQTGRMALEPLQAYLPFDLVERDGELVGVMRGGGASLALPDSELSATAEGQDQQPTEITTRAQEIDLPMEISLDYIDPARDFEVSTARARRKAGYSKSVQKIALPIVMSASAAKQVAESRLYTLWTERELARLSFSRRYLALDVGDVVTRDDGRTMRLARLRHNAGQIEAEAFRTIATTYSSAASADAGSGMTLIDNRRHDTAAILMDLPLLQATDDQPGCYVALSGLDGWKGGTLWRARDGVNFTQVTSASAAATMGIAVSALADAASDYMDRASTVLVQVMSGTLSSCGDLDLLAGANAALLGDEIVQYQNATLIAPNLYQLSNLLRGRRGTEFAASGHSVGERFVRLGAGAVTFLPALLSDRNALCQFRALTNGQSLNEAQDIAFTYGLATLRPLSPAGVAGSRAAGVGSDLTISWKRRARRNADWVDYIDVPLDEDSELYDVEVMNGGTVLRTFSSLTTPTVTYTAAQQSSDWGSVPATFTLRVYQISSRYGRGVAAVAVV